MNRIAALWKGKTHYEIIHGSPKWAENYMRFVGEELAKLGYPRNEAVMEQWIGFVEFCGPRIYPQANQYWKERN